MTTYTISVMNQSGFDKTYTVFMAPPRVKEDGSPLKVYTNAWATLSDLVTGAFDSLQIYEDLYAFWGQTRQALKPGDVVFPHGVTLVSIQAQDGIAFTATPEPGFQGMNSGKAQTGCYAIAAAPDFTAADDFVFGMAKAGVKSGTVPVATFMAEPNDVFNIAPVQQFYVADLAAVPGQVIDPTGLTAVATIDFTGLPQATATVIQDADGEFTVTYN
jgi:hypothetical protein